MHLNLHHAAPSTATEQEELEGARSAWRAVAVAAALNVVGMGLDLLLIGRNVPGVRAWPNVVSMLFGASMLVILIARWRRPNARLAGAIFFADAAVIAMALWFTNMWYADSGRAWVPFQANKLGMFTVALLAPDVWSGVGSIALYAGTSLVQRLTFSTTIIANMALGEPGATVAVALFALTLLVLRIRRSKLEQRIVRAQTQARVLRDFARISLDLRDLANTPLQTIAFSTAVIRRHHPELETVLEQVDHSIARLKELSSALKTFEGHADWEKEAEGDGSPPRR
jgi:hypothetical protein